MPRPRSWTDDDLRRALDGATTMRQVVERLGLSTGGGTYTTVRTRIEVLGLSPPRTPGPAPTGAAWRRRFTDGELREAVAAARSLHGVFVHLGITVGGSQWATIRALIRERGWSTTHWGRPLEAKGWRGAELETFRAALATADLTALVGRSTSRADVIRALGFEPRPSLYRILRGALLRAQVDTAHFEPAHAAMQRNLGRRPRIPLGELLVRGCHVDTHRLKLRLIEEGVLTACCSRCRGTTWLGGPLPLELDHVDGDRTDNRLENLRLLCPNCHALTDTYCGRNIGRR